MLKHKISLLEANNAELQRELKERMISCEHLSKRAIDAQVWSNGHNKLLDGFWECISTCYLRLLRDNWGGSVFQVEKDNLIIKLESARSGKSWEEIDSDSNQVRIGGGDSIYVF